MSKTLTNNDYCRAAKRLACEVLNMRPRQSPFNALDMRNGNVKPSRNASFGFFVRQSLSDLKHIRLCQFVDKRSLSSAARLRPSIVVVGVPRWVQSFLLGMFGILLVSDVFKVVSPVIVFICVFMINAEAARVRPNESLSYKLMDVDLNWTGARSSQSNTPITRRIQIGGQELGGRAKLKRPRQSTNVTKSRDFIASIKALKGEPNFLHSHMTIIA